VILLLKRLWLQINTKRKKQLGLVMVLMLMASVAEIVSIGAVIPFLGILSNPELVFEHERLQFFINYFGITNSSQLLFPFTMIFTIAALLAGLIRIALLWSQTRIATLIGADLSFQIYNHTLHQAYSEHIAQNSSEVIATISTKTDHVVGQTLLPILAILSSFIMLSAILILLILIHPAMTFSAIAGFAFIYIMLILTTKKKLHLNSHIISRNTNKMIKFLQEGLGGIRDIIIDGSQATYAEAFKAVDGERRRRLANNQIMAQGPRYGVEALGMVLIALLALSLSGTEAGLIAVLPMVGALAVGAQRMLPMLQHIYGSFSLIRGSEGVLKDSLTLLERPPPKAVKKLPEEIIFFNKEIVLRDLGFCYQNNMPWILSKINMKIPKGSMIGFIGTTGAGKSTLLDIIMALLLPSKGSIEVDGVEINEKNYRGWQSHIAHIPQSIYLSDTSIAENIAFGLPRNQIDYKRVVDAAKKAQIDETIQSWDEHYDTLVGERGVRLSGGQRQRIGIARALYKNSDVMIFDEATSALDQVTEKAVMDAINEISKDVTILIVAHRLSTLKNCDSVVELENGKINIINEY
tara:strand:+ start:11425 stop:13161 length:1737 start_codon:yes stop_codon:yes gene_type:complete